MKRTLFAAAVAALVVPLVALADHRPGHDKGQANPNLTIKADPNPVVFGRTVTISGRLRGSDNTGKMIELEEDPFPFDGQFHKTGGTAMTDAQGDYSFQETPEEHTQYRTVAKVTPEETSETLTVRVRKRITRHVDDRTPARGEMVTFSGVVRPAHDGMTVIIQRRRPSGTWKRMATTTLQHVGPGDESSYSQAVEIRRDGVWRTKVKADADHLGNHSRRVRLDVP
jgi:hypothetical protein